jgi:prevent-host-death family protein
MNTIRLSSTAARNRFFELLNLVALGNEVVIEKDNREVAVLSQKSTKTDWKGLIKSSKTVRGIFKEVDVMDNPLRRKGASDFLGHWDV